MIEEPVFQVLAAVATVLWARYPLLWVVKRRLG